MRRTLTSILLGLCLATLAQAAASTVEDQIKIFQEKATAALEKRSQQPGADPRTNNYASYGAGALSQLALRWQSNPASQEFEQLVMQAVSMTGNDAEVLKAANDLLSATKKDREDRIAVFRAEIKSLLAQTGTACLSAKSPVELDKTLELLAPYRENNYANQRQIDPATWQRGANAYRFATRWQDYLAELNARRETRSERTTSILNELANLADPELMPRSRILALIPAPAGSSNASSTPNEPIEEITAIIGKLEAPDQLGEAIEKLRKLRGPSYNQVVDEVINTLNSLADLQSKLKEGEIFPGIFNEANRYPSTSAKLSIESRETLAQLRRIMLLSAAGSYLKASGITPKKGELLEAYIHRVAAHAAKQDDWQLVRSALEVYRASLGGASMPQWLASDIEAIGTYIAARNQELAGLYAQAISSYQRVLRGSGKYVPAKNIGERLAALKKSQPEAFEEASRVPEPVPYNPYQRPRPTINVTPMQSSAPPAPIEPSMPKPAASASATAPAPTSQPPAAKTAPPATEALIKRNLRQLQAAGDQYCLEHGVGEVASPKLYGPEKDKYIRELKPVAGEDYSRLLIKEGSPISVVTSDGATVTFTR